MRLRYHTVWLTGGWLLVVLVVTLSLMPHPPEPLAFAHADKLEHAASYATLSYWFCQLYRSAQLRVMALLVALGVLLEVLQGFTGYRFYDVLDMLANSSGVLLGWLIVRTPLGRLFAEFERLLLR
ncbi:MAG: VanZ family protein [Gallionella sp.]|nr:VanZ family protein [Gallionella sp.]MDD4946062.1 VanZ family protein [Gallionella sp.]MDD5613142.1 VanZ family protein [Gallionella sp.]